MTLSSGTYPNVFKKNAIYVRISPDGKAIILEDENGQGGGNVYGREGHKVTWVNDASFAGNFFQCKLTFRQWLPDDDDAYGGPLWPFDPESDPNPPNSEVSIAAKTSEGVTSSWPGHLKRKNGVKYYKYDVELISSNGAPTPPGIDPIVIIED